MFFCFFFQAEDGIRDIGVTGVQTCALPISIFSDSLTTGYLSKRHVPKPKLTKSLASLAIVIYLLSKFSFLK